MLYVYAISAPCPCPSPLCAVLPHPGHHHPGGRKLRKLLVDLRLSLAQDVRHTIQSESVHNQCTKGFAYGTKQIHAVVMVFKISTSSNTTLSKRVGSSSLDPSSFRGDLRKRRQVAIFLTTHDHYAAQDRCPRACWLGRGLCALGCPGPAYQVCRVVHADAG